MPKKTRLPQKTETLKAHEKPILALSRIAMSTIKGLVRGEPLGITGMSNVGGNWEVLVDVLERKAVPDTQDIIGKYKLVFRGNDLVSYQKLRTTHRGDVGEEAPAEELGEEPAAESESEGGES